MAFDSHSTNPPSSITGTRPFALSRRYSGVLTTPNLPPASMRSYATPSSFAQATTFCTLTEERRPQILSMKPPSNTWHCGRVPRGTDSREHNLR